MDRRKFIAATGVSFSALMAGCSRSGFDVESGTNAESKDDDSSDTASEPSDQDQFSRHGENGAVVITYDDAPLQDYTQAFPVHQEFDAPATIGVVTDSLTRDRDDGVRWMNVDQLSILQSHGWEIASHTTSHADLDQARLTEDIVPGDDRIYPTRTTHADPAEKSLEITDGEKSVTRTVLGGGTDGTGSYIQLDEEINQSFDAESTVERYTSSEMNHFLGDSKAILEEEGFTVDTLIAPYDAFGEWVRRHAKQYYIGVANAYVTRGRVNSPIDFDPFETKRGYFIEETSRDVIEDDLDEIARNGSLGIFAAHTEKDVVSPEEIRTTLEMIDDRGIEVLTLRDAITRLS
ncbi:polysaccharide deacetylase family protein [Haloterrigena salinisoli]|uniref:polysaccharide deacetylase family protein n=1 Tax=Haloterrigena salinisoli TaxID=3132747 RepID=UPI0030CC78BA